MKRLKNKKTKFAYIFAQLGGENEIFIHGIFTSTRMIKKNIINFNKKFNYEIYKFPINNILPDKLNNKNKIRILNNLHDYGYQYLGTFKETQITRDLDGKLTIKENQKVEFWPKPKKKIEKGNDILTNR
jgi:hypothetical protein